MATRGGGMFKTIKEALVYIEARRTKRTFQQFQETIEKHHFNIKLKNMIHIAGTNGKGSTVTYLKEILVFHGYRVGTFTSPYLIDHNDRICINGVPIRDEDLLTIINDLYPIIEQEQLSMFEIDILIMLKYFNNENLDYHIIETGIGGTNDKTNVLSSKISAITNIGYDHQFMLGNTLQEIASHKAGIIKENQIFLTTETNQEILSLFNTVCDTKQTVMKVVEPLTMYSLSNKASYQKNNAALALAIAKECILIDARKVQSALHHFSWPGRFEQFGKVYLDGAHNIDGIKELVQTIKENKFENVGIIFSALQDKDVDEMLALLKEYSLWQASFDDERFLMSKGIDFKKALFLASQQKDTIIVTGSLHFISAVRKYLVDKNS